MAVHTATRLLTSKGRPWAGFLVDLFFSPAGLIEAAPSPHHQVMIHAGAPARSTCRYDGRVHRRVQTYGNIDIVPAALPAVWEDEDASTFLSLRLPQALMRSAADDLGLGADPANLMPSFNLRDPKIEHIAWALEVDLEGDGGSERLYAESLGLALAAHLLVRYADASPPHEAEHGLPVRRLRAVIDYIEAKLDANLSLAELAAVAGFSASHFKLLFRRSVGVPVHQYVIRRRVERARVLLLAGRAPMSEIALEAGFAHQSHMARHMRKILGATPAMVAASRR